MGAAVIFIVKPCSLVVANNTTAIIRQKENDFLAPQNLDNIENTTIRNPQNNGLEKEK